MDYRIEILSEKKLVGKHLTMSLTDNKTTLLWKSFMQERSNITNNVGSDLYSMQVYDQSYFKPFNPASTFEKWATTEVTDFNSTPEGMESLTLTEGRYAVFIHKGGTDKAQATFQYIYGTWLPYSEYVLDDRPNFEVLGEKYKNDDPNSEEEVWIPIRDKN